MLRLDLHVHTTHSVDGFCTVKDAVAAARARGLDGFALTDHDTVSGHREAKSFSKRGFVVIPGIEVSSSCGHIVGLGVGDPIPRGLSPAETVDRIKKQGGVAIVAHPFVMLRSFDFNRGVNFDAVETLNARAIFPSNRLAERFARLNGLNKVAGSDSHRCDEIGLAYTRVDCEPKLDAILEKIKKGETSVGGRTLPLPIFLWRALQKSLHRT